MNSESPEFQKKCLYCQISNHLKMDGTACGTCKQVNVDLLFSVIATDIECTSKVNTCYMVNRTEAHVQICGGGGGSGIWYGFPPCLRQMTHLHSSDLIHYLAVGIYNHCLMAVNVVSVPA